MASSNTDNDAWLRRLRCPQYFDFESALSVPAVPDSSTNPPLRDCVYESDEETREFFRELDKNPALHATPHEQILSPLPEKLRNQKPVTHNQLKLSFEEYLKQRARKGNSEPSTPTKSGNTVSTPNGTPQPNTNGLRRRGSTADSPANTPRQGRSRLPTPRRPKASQSSGGAKAPVNGERAAKRRIRLPERISPPIGSKLSSSGSRTRSGATTSGPERVTKSRSAILHEEDHRKLRAPSTYGSSNEKNLNNEETQSEKEPALEINLPETDNDVLKMVEEHNRRIRRKQNRSDGDAVRMANESGMTEELPNVKQRAKSLEDKRRAHTGEALSHYPGRTREGTLPVQSGGVKKRVGVGSAKATLNQSSPIVSLGSRLTETAKEKPTKTTKPVPFSFTTREKEKSTFAKILKENQSGEPGPSLEDLLQSGNKKIIDKRKKRLPERRRVILANENGVLRDVRGETSAYLQKSANVVGSFTHAKEVRTNGNDQENVGLVSAAANMQTLAVSMKQRANAKSSAIQIESTRGLRGFRARNQNGLALQSHLHGNASKVGPGSRATQMPSVRSSLSERRKVDESLSKDLQSILSLHNSRIEGKRKVNVDPKR